MKITGNFSEEDVKNAHFWDMTIGLQFIPFFFLSTIGNSLAFRYFVSRPKNLPTILYICITVVDMGTGMAHFPVAGTLLNHRKPWLFKLKEFCIFWTIFFSLLQKFSMFLVMLLTVSRTIKIVYPFAEVRKRAVIAVLILYGIFLLASDIAVTQYGINFFYSKDCAYCYEYNGSYYGENTEIATVLKMVNFRFVLQVGIPPVIISFSFAVSLAKLYFVTPTTPKTLMPIIRANQRNRKQQASITITLFTGIFLMCNSLFFITKSLESVTYFMNLSYPGPFFQNTFMFWFSWPIGKVYLTVLNTVLNPFLYYLRIKEFRKWVWSSAKKEENTYSMTGRRGTGISELLGPDDRNHSTAL